MKKNRLFEVFEHVNGVQPEVTSEESNWTDNDLESLLTDMGQEYQSFTGNLNGISQGDFGRVKFSVKGGVLYLEFPNPETAHMAFNSLSSSLSNPYEFSSRFDQMPTTVMVQMTNSGINEDMLSYVHVDDAQPSRDKYQIGMEDIDLNEEKKDS